MFTKLKLTSIYIVFCVMFIIKPLTLHIALVLLMKLIDQSDIDVEVNGHSRVRLTVYRIVRRAKASEKCDDW